MKSIVIKLLPATLLFMAPDLGRAQANLHREYLNASQHLHTRQINQNNANLYTIISGYEEPVSNRYGSLFTQINANSTPVNNILHQGASPQFTLRPYGLYAYTTPSGTNLNVICGQSADRQMDMQPGSYIMETSESGKVVNWAKYYSEFSIFNAVVAKEKGYIACGQSGNSAGFLVTSTQGASFAKYITPNTSPIAFDRNISSVYQKVIPLNNHRYAMIGTCSATRDKGYMEIYSVSFLLLTIYDAHLDRIIYNGYLSNNFDVAGDVQETGKSLAYDPHNQMLYIAGEKRTGRICQYQSHPILLRFDVGRLALLSYDEYPTDMVSMVNEIHLDFEAERPSIWILGTNNNIEETNYYLGQARSLLLEIDKSTLAPQSLEIFDNNEDLILRSFVLEPNYNLKLVGNAYHITQEEDEDGNQLEIWTPNNRIYQVQTRQYGHQQHCNDYYGQAQYYTSEYADYRQSYVRNKSPFIDFDVRVTILNRSQHFVCETTPNDDDEYIANSIKPQQKTAATQPSHIYPNPADQLVTITGDNNEAITNVSVFTMSGACVYEAIPFNATQTKNSCTIDVSTLANGLYILKVQYGASISHQQLMINR